MRSFTVHLTEDQARHILRGRLRLNARLSLWSSLAWFGGGGFTAFLGLTGDFRYAVVGGVFGTLFTAWTRRQVGLDATVAKQLEADRASGTGLLRSVQVDLLPEGLRVHWDPGSATVSWSGLTVEPDGPVVHLRSPGQVLPLVSAPLGHPLLDAIQQPPATPPHLSLPDHAAHLVRFTFDTHTVAVAQRAVGHTPRIFRKALVTGILLVAFAGFRLVMGSVVAAIGLGALGALVLATSTVEHWARWLMPRQKPLEPYPVTFGLLPGAWFAVGPEQRSIHPFRTDTPVVEQDGHIVLHDHGLVVALPLEAMDDPDVLRAAIQRRVSAAPTAKQASTTGTRPPSIAVDNPYAPPRASTLESTD